MSDLSLLDYAEMTLADEGYDLDEAQQRALQVWCGDEMDQVLADLEALVAAMKAGERPLDPEYGPPAPRQVLDKPSWSERGFLVERPGIFEARAPY